MSRIRVKFLVDTHGFVAGEERNFRPSVAMGLIKSGFAEELMVVADIVTPKKQPIMIEAVEVVAEVHDITDEVNPEDLVWENPPLEVKPKAKRTRKKKNDNSSNSDI
jgi:hypothetical protein